MRWDGGYCRASQSKAGDWQTQANAINGQRTTQLGVRKPSPERIQIPEYVPKRFDFDGLFLITLRTHS